MKKISVVAMKRSCTVGVASWPIPGPFWTDRSLNHRQSSALGSSVELFPGDSGGPGQLRALPAWEGAAGTWCLRAKTRPKGMEWAAGVGLAGNEGGLKNV